MKTRSSRLTGRVRDDHGVALFAAVVGMLVLSTMMVALAVLARNEIQISQLTKDEAQAAYAAEAGANWGRRLLAQRLNADLPLRVALTPRPALKTALQTSYTGPTNYAGAAQFLLDYAIPSSGPAFQACGSLTDGCPEPNYSAVGTIPDAQQVALVLTCPGMAGCPANATFTTRVVVGAHPTIPPALLSGGNGALFTYVWRIESSGTAGRARQQWVIHDSSVPTNTAGSFTIALNAQFVQYAHFIDQFQDAGSGNPWISWRHKYTGPVHTNTRFSLLGDTSVSGREGPTFRSETTQTLTTTRFNNGGSAQNLTRDSSARDWPILGPTPGILCKEIDCSGFTRGFDYDPTTAALDPIPFPGGSNPDDRRVQICMALGYAGGTYGRPECPPTPPTPNASCNAVPVVVDNNCTDTNVAELKGGIYVWPGSGCGDCLPASGGVPYVRNVLLAHTDKGQTIVIYTQTNRRTVIEEDRTMGQVRVRRECRKATPNFNDDAACAIAGSGGTQWWLLGLSEPGAAIRQQTFTGVFSPELPAPADTPPDSGMIYVAGANVGQAGTVNGLRRGTFVPLSPASSNDTNGGVDLSPAYAIYQDPTQPARGMRLTVAGDRNIWITGHLNYRVDPRGGDGVFSEPVPGDPTGTSADDQMDVQNVLGVVSWATPSGVQGGVRLSSALTGDLQTHGMIFAANLSGQAKPSGQFSFDDPNGPYRGVSTVLGGVVQKTMGTFGQPSSNLGYERDWIYDERFRYRALSPPAFPGFPNFTAASGLGIDSYSWRLGLF
jgi:hypothetical protein